MSMLPNDWRRILEKELGHPYFQSLHSFLDHEYATQTVYPPRDEIWSAFCETSFDEVKVVLLGQDPYHGPEQAHGMSFSVKPGVPHPPSLQNIMKELSSDLGCSIPTDGTLTKWAKQGVLLLNTVLTVREGQANSHRGQGWEQLTDIVIQKLSQREKPVVFLLWGRPAQQKLRYIDSDRNAVITAPHPSPLSAYRGFFGSKPFSKVNEQLVAWGESPIDFCLD